MFGSDSHEYLRVERSLALGSVLAFGFQQAINVFALRSLALIRTLGVPLRCTAFSRKAAGANCKPFFQSLVQKLGKYFQSVSASMSIPMKPLVSKPNMLYSGETFNKPFIKN